MRRFVILVLIFTSIILAQSAGSAGLSFLKNGSGARNIALGDLGVVGNYNISSVYYNPAVIGKLESSQIIFNHQQSMQDVTSDYFSGNAELLGIPLALSVNTTSVSDIEVRTGPGIASSTFNAQYSFASLSTGFNFDENIFFGATVRLLYESLLSDDATGYGFDFGGIYTNFIDGFDLGISIRNLGTMDELRNEATELPADLRIGVSHSRELQSIDSKLLLVGGIQKYTATDDTHIHAGAEILFRDFIALRGGYISGYESKGITAGFGVIWSGLNFDYAYAPYDFGLGDAHTISLMYSF